MGDFPARDPGGRPQGHRPHGLPSACSAPGEEAEYPVKPRPRWGRGVCACWSPSPGHSAHRPSGRHRPGHHGAGHWEPLFIPGVHRSCSPLRAVGHPVCGLCTQELTEGFPPANLPRHPAQGLGGAGGGAPSLRRSRDVPRKPKGTGGAAVTICLFQSLSPPPTPDPRPGLTRRSQGLGPSLGMRQSTDTEKSRAVPSPKGPSSGAAGTGHQ